MIGSHDQVLSHTFLACDKFPLDAGIRWCVCVCERGGEREERGMEGGDDIHGGWLVV